MPKIAWEDRTEVKLQLIHAIIAGQALSYSAWGAAGPEDAPRISIELEFDPSILRKLNELHKESAIAATPKRKKR
jgi:hypothetical protein